MTSDKYERQNDLIVVAETGAVIDFDSAKICELLNEENERIKELENGLKFALETIDSLAEDLGYDAEELEELELDGLRELVE